MKFGKNQGPPSISAQRREAVDRPRQRWIRKLSDLSGCNNLLYYRPLKAGTLDLYISGSILDGDALVRFRAGVYWHTAPEWQG